MRQANKENVAMCLEYLNKDTDTYTFEKFLQSKNLLSDYKMQGQNIVLPCPFHKDDSPSMSIDPVGKRYRCFSCERKGNGYLALVYQYAKEIEGLSGSFYEMLDNLLKSDKVMQLQLGINTIFTEQKINMKDFTFSRNKVNVKAISNQPTTYLELASDMLKNKKTSYNDIKLFILLMQANTSVDSLYDEVYRDINLSTGEAQEVMDFSISIDDILGGN